MIAGRWKTEQHLSPGGWKDVTGGVQHGFLEAVHHGFREASGGLVEAHLAATTIRKLNFGGSWNLL